MALPIAYSVLAAAHGGAKQTSKANADAIKEGASLFRANCSPCHGLNAHGGGRGPDLTSGRWTHGSTDDDLFRTITQGVPGTDMPANSFEDSETHTIIVYLRSLALPKNITVVGNAEKGKKIFFGAVGCSNCHMVRGIGGVLGPDLSRVGAARSVSYLVESIRDPDKELSVGMADPNNHYVVPLVYDTVTVITANGERITGVARNERHVFHPDDYYRAGTAVVPEKRLERSIPPAQVTDAAVLGGRAGCRTTPGSDRLSRNLARDRR
jgi:putative heme-binding domain-containing protein